MTKRLSKKQRKNIIYGGIGLGAILILVIGFFLMGGSTGFILLWGSLSQTQLTGADSCYVTDSGSTTTAKVCSGECTMSAQLNCNTITETNLRVVFRTNAQYGKYNQNGVWIAFDRNGDGALESYTWGEARLISYDGWEGNYKTVKKYDAFDPIVTFPKDGIHVGYDTVNKVVYVWKDGETQQIADTCCRQMCEGPSGPRCCAGAGYTCYKSLYTYYVYKISDDGVTSIYPTDPYKSNNQEMTEGDVNTYKCDVPVYINNVEKERLSYSDKVPGIRTSSTYSLTTGQEFKFDGKIFYTMKDTSRACSVDVCNPEKTGVISCKTDSNGCKVKSSTVELCSGGAKCFDSPTGASCESPISTTVVFLADNGEQTTGFASGQNIHTQVSVSSSKISSATGTYVIVDSDGNAVSPVQNKILDFSKPNNFKLDFSPISTNGEYYLKVTYTYSGQESSTKKFRFNIANQLYVNIKTSSIGSKLQVGSPITIEIRTSSDEEGRVAVAATTTPTATATINGKAVSVSDCKQETTGIYTCVTTVNEAGTLSIKARAERFGYIAEKTISVGVDTAEIFIEFLNIDNYKRGVDINSNNIIEFTTKNLAQQLLATTNEVEIIRPGQAIGSGTKLTPSGSNGNYKFTFSPTSEEGGWTIYVRSEAPGYDKKETLPQIINVAPGNIPTECASDDECSSGQLCINGSCSDPTPNYLKYILIVIGIIVVVIIIILVFRFIKNKKTSTEMIPI